MARIKPHNFFNRYLRTFYREKNMRNNQNNHVFKNRAVAVVGIVLLSGLQAFGATAQGINRPKTGETVEVLVQYANQPTAEQHRRVADRNGRIRVTFANVPVAHYDVTPEALADLEANPDVVSISPNLPLQGFKDRVTCSSNYWPLYNHYVSTGRKKAAGIGVAIVDSGISTSNPNFNLFLSSKSRIVYSESFVGGDTNDQFGHGTHVAGIAVGTDASVIAGINRAIALKSKYNIRVMNLSLGRPITQSYKTDPLNQAVEAAWKAGIVVVVAAGNGGRDNSQNTLGYGTITAPGNDPYVITVGAPNDNGDYDRTDDVMTTYSAKGPTAIDHIVKPDLVAPGNQVVA